MAILPIITFPDPVLRRVCKEVTPVGPGERKLINDMVETMFAAPGSGLAAPQVGKSLRIIIVSLAEEAHPRQHIVMVNPEIVELSGEEVLGEEGCLSVVDYTADIKRPSHIRIKYLDKEGRPQEGEYNDWLARVCQHEIDHLDGILFFDHLGRLKRDLVKRRLIKAAKRGK